MLMLWQGCPYVPPCREFWDLLLMYYTTFTTDILVKFAIKMIYNEIEQKAPMKCHLGRPCIYDISLKI